MASRCAGQGRLLIGEIADAVRSGHGVVTIEELDSLGLSRAMITSRLASGQLVPVLRGVVTLPGVVPTEKGRWRAAVCSSGTAFLSRRSALALHGLIRDRGPIEVVRRAGAGRTKASRTKSSPGFGFSTEYHQTRYLPNEHQTEIDGIRTTTIERALRDFAACATSADLTKVLTQGEREGSIDWQVLNELLRDSVGHKGVGDLRRVVSEWDPVQVNTFSDPEEDFLLMLRRKVLPIPQVNVPIAGFVVDFYWPELDLAVELDPYGTHRGKASFDRDHRKSVELEARGIRVIRFLWEDLYLHEDRTASELRRIIAAQAQMKRR